MDEQLVVALRRRGERGTAPDVEASFGDVRTAAATRRRRRRRAAGAIVGACVVVIVAAFGVVTLTGGDDHAEVAIRSHEEPLPAGWSRHDARRSDVSIGLPPGWSANDRTSGGRHLRPVVSVGSTPDASTDCDTSRPGAGSGVAVYEVIDHVDGEPYTFPEPYTSLAESRLVERPSDFASAEPVSGFGCVNGRVSPSQALQTKVYLFRDHGRTFFAVAATNDPPFSDFDPAFEVLDTLRVGGGAGTATTTTTTTPPSTRGTAGAGALQLRPVIGQVPPADPTVAVDDPTARADVASCDIARIGVDVPTTPEEAVDPKACVVLTQDGVRYLLGPARVDGRGVATAEKDFRSGMGWIVDIEMTPTGAVALDDLARRQFHEQVALVADGVLLASPVIQPDVASFESFDGHIVTSVAGEAEADAVVRAFHRR